ncbi:MAG: DUF3293 domain-containing protein [Armatimonadaceae bacterium]
MTEALDAAYRAAVYRVAAVPPFALRVGEPSTPLDALLRLHAVKSWAFVTACNPWSEPLSLEENAERMIDLRAAVGGHVVYECEGTDPNEVWPDEPSLLVLGMCRSAAMELARRFGQNAFLCGDSGGVVELHWVK